MKPYDKKIINKKITQALIGVTALGTILSLPVSIDMQDNGIRIVRNNKVFAADNFKGLTGNVEWINGDFNNNIWVCQYQMILIMIGMQKINKKFDT
ncbi:hypothetical protein C1146_12565 [Clostridium botulinum]|nr:hypothetical protein C1146_12565 [Clostridium botulinum]